MSVKRCVQIKHLFFSHVEIWDIMKHRLVNNFVRLSLLSLDTRNRGEDCKLFDILLQLAHKISPLLPLPLSCPFFAIISDVQVRKKYRFTESRAKEHWEFPEEKMRSRSLDQSLERSKMDFSRQPSTTVVDRKSSIRTG